MGVLVVEDDEDFARRVLGRVFDGGFDVRYAADVEEALAAVEAVDDLAAAIVDLNVPGPGPFDPASPRGRGFAVIEAVRRRFPRAEVVALTGYIHPELVSTAQRHGAIYVLKSNCGDNLRAVADRARGARDRLREEIDAFLDGVTRHGDLTRRQRQIVALSIAGWTHAEIADQLGISANTLKRHVRHVLAACGERSLDAIARRFWRHAVGTSVLDAGETD